MRYKLEWCYLSSLPAIVFAFALVALPGCQYFQQSTALIADGIGSYCDASTPLARDVIRAELDPELQAEGLEICLGCAGEPTTQCTGAHRPKVDDQ